MPLVSLFLSALASLAVMLQFDESGDRPTVRPLLAQPVGQLWPTTPAIGSGKLLPRRSCPGKWALTGPL